MTPKKIEAHRNVLKELFNSDGRCNVVLGESKHKDTYEAMLTKGKHTDNFSDLEGITMVFQDATSLGNNADDKIEKLLNLVDPTKISATKDNDPEDGNAAKNMVLLVGEGYTEEDALDLKERIGPEGPIIMFYENPAEIKVDEQGHFSIELQTPPEEINLPSDDTQEASQHFFKVAYTDYDILPYNRAKFDIPSSAAIAQTNEVATDTETVTVTKSREELIRELNIQEKIVELLREEKNKKLGDPEGIEKKLQELRKLEETEETTTSHLTKMKQSLSNFKETVEELMGEVESMDEEENNHSPEIKELLSITNGFKNFTHDQFVATIDNINTYEAYNVAQVYRDEIKAQLKELGEPMGHPEEKEKEQEEAYKAAYENAKIALESATAEVKLARKAEQLGAANIRIVKDAIDAARVLITNKSVGTKIQSLVAIANMQSAVKETYNAIATTASTDTLDLLKRIDQKGNDAIRSEDNLARILEARELVNEVANNLKITAVHAESEVMIAKIKKKAIAFVAGIQEEATIGAKAASHELDHTAMFNVLGGLNSENRANETVSDDVTPKKISAGMAVRLIYDLNSVEVIIKEYQNSSADKKLANEMKTEILKILNEFKVRITPLDNLGISAQNIKKEKGKKKGRKGKRTTKTEGTKTEEISEKMRKQLTDGLRDKKKSLDIWKDMAKKYPASATIKAITVGDQTIFLKIHKLTALHTRRTATTTDEGKPQTPKR